MEEANSLGTSYEDNASISHNNKSHQNTNNLLIEDVERVDLSSTHKIDICYNVEPKDIKGLNKYLLL